MFPFRALVQDLSSPQAVAQWVVTGQISQSRDSAHLAPKPKGWRRRTDFVGVSFSSI